MSETKLSKQEADKARELLGGSTVGALRKKYGDDFASEFSENKKISEVLPHLDALSSDKIREEISCKHPDGGGNGSPQQPNWGGIAPKHPDGGG